MRRAALVVLLGACGRIGFDSLPAEIASDGSSIASDGSSDAIAWVKSFVAQSAVGRTTDTFMTQADQAGDVFLLHVACQEADGPNPVTVSTSPVWPVIQLSPLAGAALIAFSFGAIAPDMEPTQFTVTWGGPCAVMTELGDEFTNNDIAGGGTTFDGEAEAGASGDCAVSVMTGHAGDAVWSACTSSGEITATGSGYTKGADDGLGVDGFGGWSEYKITSDPAGMTEMPTFANSAGNFVTTAVTIKPR